MQKTYDCTRKRIAIDDKYCFAPVPQSHFCEKKNTFRPIYFEICYVYNKSYAIPYSIKLQAHACSESNPLPFHWRSFRYRDMDSHLSNMVRGCMQILIF